ncbi:leucine zipper putative tumor suppressor 2 homolog isoform X2 [Wyeomyia smithii]|uniref:leucine zipper putative tumor suppressor 2 homolog isoform X2 n=1 Tax=Wyeomyia smithii TaxID=174621 RepID=UPI002467E4AC|nr:leucine zipper putative tumor suppressor 2 homolog isoform X2 [Wyeomyia smithii]
MTIQFIAFSVARLNAMESLHNGAPSSLVIAHSPATYKSPLRPKGHYRSSSLENNPFVLTGGKSTLSLVPTSFTGTLKSRREQKRISDFLSKQAYSSGTATSLDGTIGNGREQNESSIRKAHFENIREIFEKNNSKNAHNNKLAATSASTSLTKFNSIVSVSTTTSGHDTTSGVSLSTEDKPPKIQSCSGILGKGKQVIRPIAFKPVPYKCNTPNYTSPASQNGGRLTDLGERYGSTPSLGPAMSIQYKFGSTTDLHAHNHNIRHSEHGGVGSVTSNGLVATNGPSSVTYQHQYGTLTRKTSSIPFKTYDSLESILKLPDSMIASYPNSNTGQSSLGLYAAHDLLDMAPSPSDSGISELEAALRDRDSELAYLRQTMEHNEQDKEKHWEQELNRLKAIHENRLRAGAQKVHKLEQLLMMQTFQLRQDKKRLQEDVNRLHSEFTLAKEQVEHQKGELCHLKLSEKDLKDQNGDLIDEIQMLRRVVSDLKERLEESEWSLCQRNGEVALMKTQLKDAQVDITAKDQEIVQLRADIKMQNLDEISFKKSEIKKELDFDLEISQLNRIIIFKDQIIVVMNNEIQKLRKELSDISIMRGYEGVPSGRYSRYKKKLDFVVQKFGDSTEQSKSNSDDGQSGEPKPDPGGGDVKMKDDLNSSEIIRNYFNNKLELNKKLFLNTQICNYSDEDKSSMIETYNAKKIPDITLDLSSLGIHEGKVSDQTKESVLGDQGYNQSSSDDDYKSMTPTRDQDDDEEELRLLATETDTANNCDKTTLQDKDLQLTQLRQELQDCRAGFEQERLKWADEKEKVLVYQRQLQQNYIDMCKRTAVLEEKLKTFENQ